MSTSLASAGKLHQAIQQNRHSIIFSDGALILYFWRLCGICANRRTKSNDLKIGRKEKKGKQRIYIYVVRIYSGGVIYLK